jgi:hypothetical protein
MFNGVILFYSPLNVKDFLQFVQGFSKLMSDKSLNRQTREEHKENLLSAFYILREEFATLE